MNETHYAVHDGRLWYGDRALCNDDMLLVDTRELPGLGTTHGVVRMQTPRRLDIVFAAGLRGKPPHLVVGGESKTYGDLASSYHSRRLARQLRTLRDVVDVPVLFLRGPFISEPYPDPDTLNAIIGLQRQGLLVLPLPSESRSAATWLVAYRDGFAKSGLQALAGHDHPKPDRQPGWLLRRIPGIGHVQSGKLIAEFDSTGVVFAEARTRPTRIAAVVGPALARRIRAALEE